MDFSPDCWILLSSLYVSCLLICLDNNRPYMTYNGRSKKRYPPSSRIAPCVGTTWKWYTWLSPLGRVLIWVESQIVNSALDVLFMYDKFNLQILHHKSTNLTSGVPQGGNFSPLAFVIYVSDLEDWLEYATSLT